MPNVMETSVAAATARVLIVDDEPLARDCMRLALRGARNVELVAECCDGASAVDAIRAFEVNALDYVLKPFPDERLLAALDRARSAIQERRNGELGRVRISILHPGTTRQRGDHRPGAGLLQSLGVQ